MRRYLAASMLAALAVVTTVGPAAVRTSASWESYNWIATHQWTITGVVEKTDDGMAILSSGGHKYMISGKDLSGLVGKKIAVTGKFSKTGGKDTIVVTSYRTCEYC